MAAWVDKRSKGATSLEYALILTIFTVLFAVLFAVVRYYQEWGEKMAVELTIMNLKSGIRYRVGELMMHARDREMAEMLRQNPVNWLQKPPANYKGELSGGCDSDRAGYWFYDSGRNNLVYCPNNTSFFVPGPTGELAIRYRMAASREVYQADNPGVVRVEGVMLVQANAYGWFLQ